MIRLEPSTVLKYVELVDAFVKFRIFSHDELMQVLKDAPISDRKSYVGLVLDKAVSELSPDLKARLEHDKGERLRETLYDVCVGLNPNLDIHKVILPVNAPGKKSAVTPATKTKTQRAKKPKRVDPVKLAATLREQVIGQDEAVQALTMAVARAQAGFRDTNRPVGTFLFVGPTGVGKTELSKALADALTPGERKALVRVDCSEYAQPHEYAKLIGAPPGYVGHEDGGYLSSVLSDCDAAVVLFDEIEKADEKVHNLLLQIMDEGYATDAKGRRLDFTESIIILTSNLGLAEVEALKDRAGFARSRDTNQAESLTTIQNAMKKHFKPEFLNRIDETLVFRGLNKADAEHILDKFIALLAGRTRKTGISLEVSPEARGWFLEQGFSSQFGARELRRTVQKHLEAPLAEALVSGALQKRDSVRVELADGKIRIAPQAVSAQ
jgi:ATP-dependent Clp protease ATP-binding subunit ClpC